MTKCIILTLFLTFTAISISIGQNKPNGLLVNLIAHTDKAQALIYSSSPLFSWIVPGKANGTRQISYRLIVSNSVSDAQIGKGNVWDSGVVNADSSIAVTANGLGLKSSKQYYWRVKTRTNTGGDSEWSDIKSFKTAGELNKSQLSSEALVKTKQQPLNIDKIAAKLTFIEFTKDAFAQLSLKLTSATGNDTVTISLGEAIKAGRLDPNPGGTIRYQKIKLPLEKGSQIYKIKFKKDQRNTGSAAVLMPDYIGEVFPFRYVEIEGYSGKVTKADVVREIVHYPFDDNASYFKSSNDTLNMIWDLCKYSIKATSFAGIYVDGDRERIPYEADALINQLGHYGVDREYSMARRSIGYLLEHPTWPTEWILQALIISYNDYLYTGDKQLLEANYQILKKRTLMQLKGSNGLISTVTGLQNSDFAKSINFNGKIKDIVDWPISETDGFVFNDYNAVVNAFYFKALTNMKEIAKVLGHSTDEQYYGQQAASLKTSFNKVYFDNTSGLYKDGESTLHSSLHANMFALSLGLVPKERTKSVVDFIRSKGMASSVYGSQFLMESLYEGFEGTYVRKLLTDSSIRSWYNMIRVGSTISLEAWDNKFKPNQDWNHAWGAAPANIIPRKLMGIEPIAAGFEEVRIMPQTGDLTSAEIITPTIRGSISVKITNDKLYKLQVTLPPNMRGEVYLPQLKGKTVMSRNGKAIGAKPVSGKPFYYAGKIASGTWTFIMKQK